MTEVPILLRHRAHHIADPPRPLGPLLRITTRPQVTSRIQSERVRGTMVTEDITIVQGSIYIVSTIVSYFHECAIEKQVNNDNDRRKLCDWNST